MTPPALALGRASTLRAPERASPYVLPAHHLVTHGVIVGMTGSGKTGLVTVVVEEALRARVPVLVVDVKGDLPNLGLAFAQGNAGALAPWIPRQPGEDERAYAERVASLASQREESLRAWSIDADALADYVRTTHVRVVTPGSEAGEPLHLLSSLERRSSRWDDDLEAARASLAAAVSLVLRLVGRDADPRSREHVLLSVLAEERLRHGRSAELDALVLDLAEPPLAQIGALAVDEFVSKRARKDLAASLNALLASPTFASWRAGATLDVGAWLAEVDGKTPATVVSVAHLDDEERELVLGLVLEEVLTYVRGLPGSEALRALVVFDEVYGFLPPHPAAPATKRPLVALMKQARAFGVGVLLATQNPMDLDYRALSNAGLWCLGRLQTDADRARVVEGLRGEGPRRHRGEDDGEDLDDLLKRLAARWFVVRDVHDGETRLLQPRYAISYLRGPMTREEIRRARLASASGPSSSG